MLELLKNLFTAVQYIAQDIIAFVSRSWYDFIITHVTTLFYRYSPVPSPINNSSTGKRKSLMSAL